MSVKQKYSGAPWLYSETTGDIVGVKDPDGSEFFFSRASNFGLFQALADQTTTANTPTVMAFDTALAQVGVTLAGNKLYFDRGGWFKFEMTAQVVNENTQIEDLYLWGRLNGTDIPNTATRVCVTESHGGEPGALVFERSYFANVSAGDYIEVVFMVDDALLKLKTTASTTTPDMPSGPAVNLIVYEVAQ